MKEELVQLVNEQDEATGVMEKLQAHKQGLLHRAVSVILFNEKGELLLQQRAKGKYHSEQLWSNTCCTHPRPGESVQAAAERRLKEEMGIECSLEYGFNILYKAALDNDLIEHEYDHVFIGHSNAQPVPNENEVSSWLYLPVNAARNMLKESPEIFTPWFPLLFEKMQKDA